MMPDSVPEARAACLCSHPADHHPDGWCMHRACGCGRYRPMTAESWLESLAKAGPAIWAAKNAARRGVG